VLRRFGFRQVLLVNGLIACASFAVYALLRPDMPHWLIMAMLAAGGFFRSLQFTALGSLTFADIDQEQMSRASTTSSMLQQLVQTMGVGLAALFLHYMQVFRGEDHLTWQAVSPAFLAVGVVSAVSLIWYARLPRNAGAELNGHTVEDAAAD